MSKEEALSAAERQRRLEHLDNFRDALSDPHELEKLRHILAQYLNQGDQGEVAE